MKHLAIPVGNYKYKLVCNGQVYNIHAPLANPESSWDPQFVECKMCISSPVWKDVTFCIELGYEGNTEEYYKYCNDLCREAR